MDNKLAYREFCREQTTMPVFVKDWFLDAVCEGGQWDVILEKDKEKNIIASLPYFVKQKMGFRYIAMPAFCKMMGPFICPEYRSSRKEQFLLQKLLEGLPVVDCIKQNFHYQITNWMPFYWKGFKQSSHYTYLLDLRDLSEVFEGINRNMRRNIKKAQSKLNVRLDNDPERFYQINKLSFDRQGISIPYTYASFLQQDQALAANAARQIFFAEEANGQIHSAAYLIWDGVSSYYHLSGDDPALRQSGGGILLIWEAIQYTKEVLGLHQFDFEGSMLENVARIRQQFGAQAQPYFRIWKYNSRLYEIIDFGQGKHW